MIWIWIILALIYLISPFDIIPGFLPVGWLDDVIVLILLYRYLAGIWRGGLAGRTRYDNSQKTHRQSQTGRRTSAKPKTSDPYEILEISPNADQKKIRTAYRRLANKYHPDKVAHLGKEFQKLAERRFKKIQEAYDKLTRP